MYDLLYEMIEQHYIKFDTKHNIFFINLTHSSASTTDTNIVLASSSSMAASMVTLLETVVVLGCQLYWNNSTDSAKDLQEQTL